MSDQIFRHLRILQRLTWLQASLLGVAGLGFLAPHTAAIVQIALPNGIISYPVWLLGVAGLSAVYATPALWWSFKQLDLHGFTYSRWVNWHAAVFTLFVLFVFILGPSQPGAAMIGVAVGVLYGIVSATVISRTSQRLSQGNTHNIQTPQTAQVNRHETLVSAQQEAKVEENKRENWRKQIWRKPIPYFRYIFGFLVGLPLILPFVLPLRPLDDWPWLQAYVHWMAGIVPAVAKFSTINNPYGQLAATVDALIWPPVFVAILYLWPYILIPLWRTEKSICANFFNAQREAARREEKVRAIESNRDAISPPSLYVNGVLLLFVLWVVLSDMGVMASDAPMIGPLAGDGFFLYALENHFYMSIASCAAAILAIVAYAIIPAALIGKLICRLKPDPTNNRPKPSA